MLNNVIALEPISEEIPQPYRWTAAEVYRLGELGFFEDRRIELLEGEVFDVSPPSNLHSIFIQRSNRALTSVFGPEYWVRIQMSLDLSLYSVVVPDLAVIECNVDEAAERENPTTALLVIEVSDTTLRYDRKKKGSLYARVGIQEYWILNVEERRLEVFRSPVSDEKAIFGFSYKDVSEFEPNQTVEPLAKPGAKVQVSDLMSRQ